MTHAFLDTRADIASSPLPASCVAITVDGHTTQGDGGAATYRSIAAPSPVRAWHIQSADGAWWELRSDAIRAEQLGGFGYPVAATPVDDTAALQAMFDYGMLFGVPVHLHGDSGRKKYAISSPLVVTAQATPGTLGDVSAVPPGVMKLHFCNHPELIFRNLGNAEIIAIAAVPYMLWITYTYSVPDAVQPYFTELDGIKLNGNDLAAMNLKLSWIYKVMVRRSRFFGAATNVYLDHVSTSEFSTNEYQGSYTNIDARIAGDLVISGEAFQFEDVAIRLGGGNNTKIVNNTFTGVGTNPTIIGVALMNAPTSDDFNSSRDVFISGNEFAGVDHAVWGWDTSGLSQRDIYNIALVGNHTVGTFYRPNAALLTLNNARSVTVAANHCGDDWEYENTVRPYVSLTNCKGVSVTGNTFSKSTKPAIALSACQGGAVGSNVFRNVARDAANPGVIILADSQDFGVTGNAIVQTVAGSAKCFVETGSSGRNSYYANVYPAAVTAPYQIAASSKHD